MSTITINLKYPFDISRIKPFQNKVRDAFSCRTKTTYNISSFSSAQYAAKQAVREYKESHPDFVDFEHEVYARFAESKLPEDSTVCTALKFNFSVNKQKKTIFVNVQMLAAIAETIQEDEDEDVEE